MFLIARMLQGSKVPPSPNTSVFEFPEISIVVRAGSNSGNKIPLSTYTPRRTQLWSRPPPLLNQAAVQVGRPRQSHHDLEPSLERADH